MATRLYFAGSGLPTPSPAPPVSAQWDFVTTFRRPLIPSATGENATYAASQRSSANKNVEFGQYIYGPLVAQTIAGTVKGQILAQEDFSTDDCCAQFRAYIVSSDGNTIRGVLYEVDNTALSSELPTAMANRKFPRGGAVALSSVNTQGGDFLVIEIGFREFGAAGNAVNFQIVGDQGVDLPEDETDLGPKNAWIEFSQTLVLGSDPPGVSRARAQINASIIASWHRWRPAGTSGSSSTQAVDNPPFNDREAINDVLRAWQPLYLHPQAKRAAQIVSGAGSVGDNPPFGQRTAINQVAIVTAWHKWRPSGTSGGAGVPITADNPPFQRPSIQPANLWWAQPDDWVEIITPGLIMAPDDPPFDQLQIRSTLSSVVQAWQPEWYGRQRPRRPVQGITLPIDNPPFSERRQPNLLHWEPPLPPVQARTLMVQPSAVVTNDPPFNGRNNLNSILVSWQPETPRVISKPPLTPSSVDNPPRLLRKFDQQAWEPPTPPTQARKLLVQPLPVLADDPPRQNFASLYTILGVWYKSLEQPIVLPKFLNPTVLGSPAQIDFPPSRMMRQPDYGYWWADPQPTQLRTMIPQAFVPPPPNPCFVEEERLDGSWIGEGGIAPSWGEEAPVPNVWTEETPKVC